MEEIANHIYLETGFPGVVVAALNLPRGLLLVDSPLRGEDQRQWRSNLMALRGTGNMLLVILDAHFDRTLGLRAMDSVVVGQEMAVDIIQGRPSSCRRQDIDAGAECETYDLPGNLRWMIPDMTYTDSLFIHWDDAPVILEHHPGAHTAATWLQYDPEKLLLVGDSIMLNQPPFLQWANLGLWIKELKTLLSDTYRGYTIVSGRNGVVRRKSIEKWMDYLVSIKDAVDETVDKGEGVPDLISKVPGLINKLSFNKNFSELYLHRLTGGLEAYFHRHYIEREVIKEE